ncbi:Methyltransferase-like protein 27 [Pseudocercospora fuligena]|uniref:Methyltransferase-like protein 27 n=1 Tax=Pseudocercospora fuligena TaxID=685502 RepID=A0A8H6RCT7_9PEZI|nr:Methyltransferase-like protein 27 [Pseudocercospora fuligena]
MATAITTNTANNPFLTRAYNVESPEDCRALYEEWAEKFNDDVLGEAQGYVAPQLVAQAVLAANGRLDGEILDCGCGTGLAGLALFQAGAKTIDGNDISPKMLEIARKTTVYRELVPVDLSKPITEKDDASYDVVTCVGTLTHGHVGPDPALKEFIRVTKKGGIVVATILDDIWKSHGYEAEVERLKEARKVDVVSTESQDYRKAAGVKARIVVLRKK